MKLELNIRERGGDQARTRQYTVTDPLGLHLFALCSMGEGEFVLDEVAYIGRGARMAFDSEDDRLVARVTLFAERASKEGTWGDE